MIWLIFRSFLLGLQDLILPGSTQGWPLSVGTFKGLSPVLEVCDPYLFAKPAEAEGGLYFNSGVFDGVQTHAMVEPARTARY